MAVLQTFDPASLAHWRRWLRSHHRDALHIWLVFHKGAAAPKGLTYEGAVEEALCFGWVDSLIRRLDAERYARKFTPRKTTSRWSTINRRRYAKLAAAGRLEEAGRARAPTRQNRYAKRAGTWKLPRQFVQDLKANPPAQRTFDSLAPSYRRLYVGWIAQAKKPETQQRRMREALRLLAQGKKLGLK